MESYCGIIEKVASPGSRLYLFFFFKKDIQGSALPPRIVPPESPNRGVLALL